MVLNADAVLVATSASDSGFGAFAHLLSASATQTTSLDSVCIVPVAAAFVRVLGNGISPQTAPLNVCAKLGISLPPPGCSSALSAETGTIAIASGEADVNSGETFMQIASA